ncbi:hypothetical protein E4T39_06433 [Aureobasidium subglaciale]|nr:hypothetical protein E4T39_06433 [Aureobasidium subglaciale]
MEIVVFITFSLDTPWRDKANFEISPFFPLLLLAGRPCRGRRHVYQHKPYCDRQSGSGIVAQSYATNLKRGATARIPFAPNFLPSITCLESLSTSAGMPLQGN